MILRYLLSPKILFFYLKNRFKYSSAPGEKSYGGDLGNVLEACYQETAIRKRRFRIAGSNDKTSCASTNIESARKAYYYSCTK
jgi:uncharacterized protein YllA (UPF0747 family)